MSDEWVPSEAELRDCESEDISSHACINIEMIRQGVESGDLDEERAKESIENIIKSEYMFLRSN